MSETDGLMAQARVFAGSALANDALVAGKTGRSRILHPPKSRSMANSKQIQALASVFSIKALSAAMAPAKDLRSLLSTDRTRRLKGIHLYPFGGFARTRTGFSNVAGGRFEPSRDGRGFRLAKPLAAAAS
jgi:hypothetical protein